MSQIRLSAALEPASKRASFMLTGGIFALTIATNLVLLWLYGLNHSFDSYGYMWLGQEYFDFSKPPMWFFRTLPYVLFNGALNSIDNPYPLVAIQMLTSAFAIAAFTWLLARINFLAAILIGCLLSTDLALASSNRIAHSEAMSASLILLSIFILASQADRRSSKVPGLLAAGFFFGIAFTVRSNHLPILLLIPVAYYVLYNSFKAAASVAGGIALCLILQCSYNAARAGHFALSETNSVFLITPLAVNGLVDRQNGDASSTLISLWEDRYPSERLHVDVWDAQLKLDNFRIFLKTNKNMPEEEIGQLYKKAYFETATKAPVAFLKANLLQFSRALSVRTSYLFDYNSDPWWKQIKAHQICDRPWCQTAFRNLVPIDTPFARFYHRVNVFIGQPHISIATPLGAGSSFLSEQRGESHFLPRDMISDKVAVIVAVLWAGSVLFIIALSQGKLRLIGMVCALFVFLNTASFVAAGAIVPRYTIPALPETLIIGGLFWTVIAQSAAILWRSCKDAKWLGKLRADP